MKQKKVVFFGEIMARLNPPGHQRFIQTEAFEVSYAGSEASVAVSLANFGSRASFVTKLPAHEMGQAAVNALRRYGVDTCHILRGDGRLGLYYVEKGVSQRASQVIYDRKDSAVSMAEPDEYDWPLILKEASWFHFSGITPALSEGAFFACMEAVRTAKAMGLTVSCDVNFRAKLWSRDKARKTMEQLMPYVDLCIANEADLDDVFGLHAEGTDFTQGHLDNNAYIEVAKKAKDAFGCRWVAITLRKSLSASDNEWGALLYDGSPWLSQNYHIHLVDRLGGGDAFCGGLIYSLMLGKDAQQAVEFAAAASCLKQTIEHDFNLITEQEVHKLMAGSTSGRVDR